jgi:hypothetical protein
MPPELDYLRSPATRYALSAEPRGHREQFIRMMPPKCMDELASLSARIHHERHDQLIAEWRSYWGADPYDVGYRDNVTTLLHLLDTLGKAGLDPFASNYPHHRYRKPVVNWGKLPADLQYLVPALDKYGFIDLNPGGALPALPQFVLRELDLLYTEAVARGHWPIAAAWVGERPADLAEWGGFAWLAASDRDVWHPFGRSAQR